MRRLDRSEQFAMIASREAWKDAGSPDELDKERLGVVIASGIGGVITLMDQFNILNEKGARSVSPHTVPMLMPNGPAAAIGMDIAARGGVRTAVSACASGTEAIANAIDRLRSGEIDVVVAGGSEAAIHPLPISAFAAMHALSRRNDDPKAASRPYDTDRDGFVMGEGGGAIVLELEEHALARGAKIYAELVSGAVTSDAHHITAPSPGGAGAITCRARHPARRQPLPASARFPTRAPAPDSPRTRRAARPSRGCGLQPPGQPRRPDPPARPVQTAAPAQAPSADALLADYKWRSIGPAAAARNASLTASLSASRPSTATRSVIEPVGTGTRSA